MDNLSCSAYGVVFGDTRRCHSHVVAVVFWGAAFVGVEFVDVVACGGVTGGCERRDLWP